MIVGSVRISPLQEVDVAGMRTPAPEHLQVGPRLRQLSPNPANGLRILEEICLHPITVGCGLAQFGVQPERLEPRGDADDEEIRVNRPVVARQTFHVVELRFVARKVPTEQRVETEQKRRVVVSHFEVELVEVCEHHVAEGVVQRQLLVVELIAHASHRWTELVEQGHEILARQRVSDHRQRLVAHQRQELRPHEAVAILRRVPEYIHFAVLRLQPPAIVRDSVFVH